MRLRQAPCPHQATARHGTHKEKQRLAGAADARLRQAEALLGACQRGVLKGAALAAWRSGLGLLEARASAASVVEPSPAARGGGGGQGRGRQGAAAGAVRVEGEPPCRGRRLAQLGEGAAGRHLGRPPAAGRHTARGLPARGAQGRRARRLEVRLEPAAFLGKRTHARGSWPSGSGSTCAKQIRQRSNRHLQHAGVVAVRGADAKTLLKALHAWRWSRLAEDVTWLCWEKERLAGRGRQDVAQSVACVEGKPSSPG
ncbi:unnamed protein product [Prorocentrum cordatum]|uniref:Uncharacterized protein n=1 Tax=Prorocentrum cordatum TaxID=2364126 RepID=A0ABN9QHE1_9DINO|nr:unnamed protein product [Polarella glacialis]